MNDLALDPLNLLKLSGSEDSLGHEDLALFLVSWITLCFFFFFPHHIKQINNNGNIYIYIYIYIYICIYIYIYIYISIV